MQPCHFFSSAIVAVSSCSLSLVQHDVILDNLVHASSWLLSNDSIGFWKRIEAHSTQKKLSTSAPFLLQSWEGYVANMLKNFNMIHYSVPPSTSANMDVIMQPVPPESLSEQGRNDIFGRKSAENNQDHCFSGWLIVVVVVL